MKIVILAGGLGQRLWPISRTRDPKHTQTIIGDHTLLQQTVRRLRKGFPLRDIFIVTGSPYRRTILKQLPGFHQKNILIEPERRNTAAAIGLAAYTFAKKDPEETMVSVAADHYIENENRFLKSLLAMKKIVSQRPENVCLLGIKPTYPETGYGYIETGQKLSPVMGLPAFTVKRFVEKPSLSVAKKLAVSRKFYWNPSYFAWRTGRVRELFQKFIPQTHSLLLKTVTGSGSAFSRISPQAIEYAVLEKLRNNFFMLVADFAWADVGHWASVREIQAKTGNDNVTLGAHQLLGTSGSLIYNYTNGVIATIGVKDLLVVATPDGTLVCHKDRAQDVKKVVESMRRKRHLQKFL